MLREFYSECDGGSLGPFCFLTLAEVADDTTSTADWMEGMEPDGMPPRGRWLVLGDNEYGLSLIWDAVLLYASDGGSLYDADDTSLAYDGSGPGPTGHLTLARFFERLVNPPVHAEDEGARAWAEALGHLDRLA